MKFITGFLVCLIVAYVFFTLIHLFVYGPIVLMMILIKPKIKNEKLLKFINYNKKLFIDMGDVLSFKFLKDEK